MNACVRVEEVLRNGDSFVRDIDDNRVPSVQIELSWDGSVCSSALVNNGTKAVRVRKAILRAGQLPVTPETPFYGEGFQMLGQYWGTVGQGSVLHVNCDRNHWKLPQVSWGITVYNLLLIEIAVDDYLLLAFSSCYRFNGEFRLREDGYCEIALDIEGLTLQPGESITLEEFVVFRGTRTSVFESLAERIAIHHPRLPYLEIPTGWCSWYYYYEYVTEEDITRNLEAIRKRIPELRYIQIDDGYQPYMGDWLDPSPHFPTGVHDLCRRISEQGFIPAIWVAPFIAEKDSRLFREHPDWFMMDDEGQPVTSDHYSYGGWRCGPWYALDGTLPAVQEHLEQLFRKMREEWGCRYFKLDANAWGALHGARLYDPTATRVEAYRRGMTAILRGVGDGFVLGCNAPMWPSLGMVHGMRVTSDIGRSWGSISWVARELFYRNWQHGALWMNDPDCVLLDNRELKKNNQLSDDEFLFHATAIFASGAMTLSGDNLIDLSDTALERLKKLLPPSGMPARFADNHFTTGQIPLADRDIWCVFNWDDYSVKRSVSLPDKYTVSELWSGQELGVFDKMITVDLPAHCGRVYVCVPIDKNGSEGM